MGQTLRGDRDPGGAGPRAAPRGLAALVAGLALVFGVVALAFGLGTRAANAQSAPSGAVRIDSGRFTIVAGESDARLANSLVSAALANDSFPGLPRPRARVLIAIAPDAARFREWTGPYAPEWGAAIAFPDESRIIMQGGRAGSDAGDPLVVLRHELAHLALHEYLGDLPPRWFDEGYASVAAGEWTREQTFETSLALVWRAMPSLDSLDAGFHSSATQAGWSYALAHRAVAELAALDRKNGLTNFFRNWKETAAFDRAVRLSFGITLDAFDRHWHSATRRRYGAIALVSNLSLAVGFFTLLLGPLFIARRRRDKQRLDAMKSMEAAQERAARESALQA
ncbi:MAG: hypothetical protein ABIW79_03925, partial [Gemmatimonas sp.]